MKLNKVWIKDVYRDRVLYYYLNNLSYNEYCAYRHIPHERLLELTDVIVDGNTGHVEYCRWSMETVMDCFTRGSR